MSAMTGKPATMPCDKLARALLLSALLGLSACASAPIAQRAARGPELAPHLYSVRDLEGFEHEQLRTFEPFATSSYHPTLGELEPQLRGAQVGGSPQLEAAHDHERLDRDPVSGKGAAMAGAWLIFQGYKQTLSRLDGNRCGFAPSCSRFGYHALSAHGPWGIGLTFARLLRNHAERDFYLIHPRGYLRDPIENYSFFGDEPALDAASRYDDPAQGWYMHVRAMERLVWPDRATTTAKSDGARP